MAEGGAVVKDCEKNSFAVCARNKTKYGSTTTGSSTSLSAENAEFFIKHEVKDGESLTSIALRYGLKKTHLQRVNHLWSDHIFSPTLYVPILSHDFLPDGYDGEVLSKAEVTAIRLQTKSAKDRDHANGSAGQGAVRNRTEQALAMDYFVKFDASLAQIKDSMEKREKNSLQESANNPLHLLPRKKSSISSSSHRSWNSGIEALDPSKEPEMKFLSQPISTKVKTSTLERLEKTQDELFQL